MFLNDFDGIFEILGLIPDYVEEHSVFSGMVITAFVGSFWLDRYLYQKRAEAFLGLYSKLSLYLRLLKDMLENNNRLNTENYTDGNIFALMYKEEVIKKQSINQTEILKDELNSYKKVVEEIRKTLLETDNNVSPLGVNRRKWLKSQYVIISFCYFIEDDSKHEYTNKYDKNNPKHIANCKEFRTALNFILNSIDKTQLLL